MEECVIKYKDNFYLRTEVGYKKIILTTDQDLIADSVQAIDDEFLEWFIKNPSCEEVDIERDEFYSKQAFIEGKKAITYEYKIIIPKEEPKTNLEKLPFPELVKEFAEYYKNVPLVEEPKQETLEEAAERYVKSDLKKTPLYWLFYDTFKAGAKWQQEQDNKELAMQKLAVEKQEARCTALRGVISDLQDKNKCSEEDMINFHKWAYQKNRIEESDKTTKELLKEWFEQFKKK